MILTHLALGNNSWQANVFVFSVEKERKIAVVQPEKQWVWEDGWALMKHYFLTPKFGHSTAEPHLKHHLLTRSSSRWLASQRQVSWQVPGLLIGPHGAIFPICRLMYVCGCAGAGNGKYCCPKIYFNHRCFSGPYLNKGRIAELPQFIGPGNCVLVLKEVSKRGPLLVKAKTQWQSTWKEREIHGCKPLFWGLCVCVSEWLNLVFEIWLIIPSSAVVSLQCFQMLLRLCCIDQHHCQDFLIFTIETRLKRDDSCIYSA